VRRVSYRFPVATRTCIQLKILRKDFTFSLACERATCSSSRTRFQESFRFATRSLSRLRLSIALIQRSFAGLNSIVQRLAFPMFSWIDLNKPTCTQTPGTITVPGRIKPYRINLTAISQRRLLSGYYLSGRCVHDAHTRAGFQTKSFVCAPVFCIMRCTRRCLVCSSPDCSAREIRARCVGAVVTDCRQQQHVKISGNAECWTSSKPRIVLQYEKLIRLNSVWVR